MNRSVAFKGFQAVLLALLLVSVTGCKWFHSSSSGSAPASVQGIETPSSISVVSANNAS